MLRLWQLLCILKKFDGCLSSLLSSPFLAIVRDGRLPGK